MGAGGLRPLFRPPTRRGRPCGPQAPPLRGFRVIVRARFARRLSPIPRTSRAGRPACPYTLCLRVALRAPWGAPPAFGARPPPSMGENRLQGGRFAPTLCRPSLRCASVGHRSLCSLCSHPSLSRRVALLPGSIVSDFGLFASLASLSLLTTPSPMEGGGRAPSLRAVTWRTGATPPRSSPAPGGALRSRRSLRSLLPHDGGSPRPSRSALGGRSRSGAGGKTVAARPLPWPTLAAARRSLRARRHRRRGSLLCASRWPRL